MLGSVCGRLVSPRCRQGGSAAARVQRSGSRLKSSSPVVLGRGSRRRPLVPACRSALERFPAVALASPLLASAPGLCLPPSLSTSSRPVCPPGALGFGSVPQLSSPVTLPPTSRQGLVDDKSVAPAFSEREEEGFPPSPDPGRLLQPGASSAWRREVRLEVAPPVREQQRRPQVLALPQFAGLSGQQRTGGGLAWRACAIS